MSPQRNPLCAKTKSWARFFCVQTEYPEAIEDIKVVRLLESPNDYVLRKCHLNHNPLSSVRVEEEMIRND